MAKQPEGGLTELINDIARASTVRCTGRHLDERVVDQLVAAIVANHEKHHDGPVSWCRDPLCEVLARIR